MAEPDWFDEEQLDRARHRAQLAADRDGRTWTVWRVRRGTYIVTPSKSPDDHLAEDYAATVRPQASGPTP